MLSSLLFFFSHSEKIRSISDKNKKGLNRFSPVNIPQHVIALTACFTQII